eukprot:3760716-Rhodomonas_salina.2
MDMDGSEVDRSHFGTNMSAISGRARLGRAGFAWHLALVSRENARERERLSNDNVGGPLAGSGVGRLEGGRGAGEVFRAAGDAGRIPLSTHTFGMRCPGSRRHAATS